jgi:hypothetical protein
VSYTTPATLIVKNDEKPKHILDPEWAFREGDPISSGIASLVQRQVAEGKTCPQEYLMRRNGLSRAQADEIVNACEAMSSWEKLKRFFRRMLSW